ncbi:MAG: anti-sigma factor family protein, partial [Oribacterium sp.]
MNCLEARKCMYDYLNRDLDERTLRDFLSHLEDCPECMEELKITHMVYTGV